MNQLITRWGRQMDDGRILPEYPRPGLVRDSYLNLNGPWEYCINESEQVDAYDGKILVPFSPEAWLSGVRKTVGPGQRLHYRRAFSLPDGFLKDRAILHFGAVDQECSVYLNGSIVGGHKGGYLPFSFDVTAQLTPGENVLTLCVTDRTEQAPHARGKQKLQKRGKYGSLFYTPQSGIWKTVWLEGVPDRYVSELKITPLYDDSSVCFHIKSSRAGGTARLTILDGKETVTELEVDTDTDVRVALDGFKPWSPESPFLYGVRVRLEEDEVGSYFGMRKLSVCRDKQGILRFGLNGRPYFFNGILDQGYWPDGLMTAPSDEALIYDILKLKEMGYNTIRKHIKVEPDRFYYHCDRLGMMVWQDMPNGGGDYNMTFVTELPNAFNWFARGVKDSHYRLFRRDDEEGRRQYREDLRGMVSHLYNHPSIAVWVPFNEGWGQFDAAAATRLIRELDGARLVNEACGWFDQGGGDMYSIHNYRHKLKVRPQKDRVVALTEYGGYAYPVEGHMACEKEFGYRHYHSSEELTANYRRLWEEEVYPNLEWGLCSAIYTQTSDIEEEINGLMTYDREVDKMDIGVVRRMNAKLERMFREVVE